MVWRSFQIQLRESGTLKSKLDEQRIRTLLNIHNQEIRTKGQRLKAIIPPKCHKSLAHFLDLKQFLDLKYVKIQEKRNLQ